MSSGQTPAYQQALRGEVHPALGAARPRLEARMVGAEPVAPPREEGAEEHHAGRADECCDPQRPRVGPHADGAAPECRREVAQRQGLERPGALADRPGHAGRRGGVGAAHHEGPEPMPVAQRGAERREPLLGPALDRHAGVEQERRERPLRLA